MTSPWAILFLNVIDNRYGITWHFHKQIRIRFGNCYHHIGILKTSSNQNLLNVKSANVRHVNFIPKKIIRFYREITTYSSVGRASEFWSMGQRFESQPGNCFSSYFIILSKARSRLIWISFENGNWNDSDGECTQSGFCTNGFVKPPSVRRFVRIMTRLFFSRIPFILHSD